jgi:hypothetical protein
MTNSWIANFGGTYYQYGSANQASCTYVTGDVTITRAGSTIFMSNATSSHIFTQTFSGDIHLSVSSNGAFSITDLYWKDETSGNVGNEFFGSGFVAADQVADTPTDDVDLGIGNYATLNSNDRLTLYATPTFSEGNLAMGGAGNNCDTRATHAVSSGKHYFEMKVTTYAAGIHVGVTKASDMLNTTEPPNQRVYYAGTGNKKSGSTLSAYGATYTTNDIIGVAGLIMPTTT